MFYQHYYKVLFLQVCEKHFKDDEIVRRTTFHNEITGEVISAPLKRLRLKEDAIPSIFPGCPAYLSNDTKSREGPQEKKVRLEQAAIEKSIAESMNTKKEYASKTEFQTFEKLQNCLKNSTISSHWTVIVKVDNLLILNISVNENIPILNYAITITNELNLNVSFRSQSIFKSNCYKFPMKVNNINEILNILEYFEQISVNTEKSLIPKLEVVESVLKDSMELFSEKAKYLVEFFIEQLGLLKLKPERYRYTSSTLIFASLLFYISPQSYKFIRNSGNFILPDPSTIRKISSSFKNSPQIEELDRNFLFYAKQSFLKLNDNDKCVFIMIDEIHIKPFLDYKGGNLVGTAYDSTQLANSVHVFMLQSLFSSFKDVVHMVPVSTFDSESLFNLIQKVLLGLENVGFKVLGIVTDNNSINRKAMSNFSEPPKLQHVYEHPVDKTRPLFYVIDSVHLIKCVRNNWLNQKNGFNMHYPSFDSEDTSAKTASLTSVRKLYDLESSNLLKFGYGLTRKSLWPTKLERQNVNLALKVFSVNVVRGLEELGPKCNLESYQQTADYIKIFCFWWDIVNVKSPFKGKCKLNPMCEPYTGKATDLNATFLRKFLSWLNVWHNINSDNGRLSKETHSALIQTTTAFVCIAEYCINKLDKNYVLLGKIQTDKLESRFGLYRSMSGDQYHITIRQIYETETKLRLSKDLKLASHSRGDVEVDIFKTIDDSFKKDKYPVDTVFCDITVTDADISNVSDTLPVIVYLAGYCAHIVHKKIKCNLCREKVSSDRQLLSEDDFNLIKVTDRGGLLYPTEVITNAVVHTYIVVQKLISKKYEETFMKVGNQRHLVIKLVEDILVSKEVSLCFDCCLKGHDFYPILITVIRSSTNSLLNNYCKLKNDNVKSKQMAKFTVAKRKLETLTDGKTSFVKNQCKPSTSNSSLPVKKWRATSNTKKSCLSEKRTVPTKAELSQTWQTFLGPAPLLGKTREEITIWLKYQKRKWDFQIQQRKAKSLERGDNLSQSCIPASEKAYF